VERADLECILRHAGRAARNGSITVCVAQGMEDLVVDGFLALAMEVGKLVFECTRDVVAIVTESTGSLARDDKERLEGLRSWNKRVQRSLEGRADPRFSV